MARFDGKVVLLTGAARGLGRAAAHELAQRGANLALVDVLAEEVRAVSQGIGEQATAFAADLSRTDVLGPLVERVVDAFGSIDVLINNAAICPRIPFGEATEADWEDQFSVNARAPYFLMQAVCRQMRAQGGGRIVNVISTSGQFGAVASASIYSGAKGALIACSKSVAREVVDLGITVNCFSPGTMLTDQIRNLPPEKQEEVRRLIPMGRFTSPEEMAVSLAYVASDECVFSTGATYDFVGGTYMR